MEYLELRITRHIDGYVVKAIYGNKSYPAITPGLLSATTEKSLFRMTQDFEKYDWPRNKGFFYESSSHTKITFTTQKKIVFGGFENLTENELHCVLTVINMVFSSLKISLHFKSCLFKDSIG